MKSRFRRRQNYEKYKNLIYSRAYAFHHATGIELDEFIGWGNLKFVECQKSYDPMMASFTTYLYIQITGMFLEMARKNWVLEKYITPDSIQENINNLNPEYLVLFKEMLQGLSADAKEIINIILSSARTNFINSAKHFDNTIPFNSKGQIQRYLQWRGWNFARIQKTFQEITMSLI